MDTLKNIKTKLLNINIDFNQLKPSIQEYLVKIESVITGKQATVLQAASILKRTKVNCSVISAESGISRATLYNNPVLKEYIDYSLTQFLSYTPFDKNNDIRERVKLLEHEIKMMEIRDLDYEKLYCIKQVKNKNIEISNLRNRIQLLVKELNDLNHSLKK